MGQLILDGKGAMPSFSGKLSEKRGRSRRAVHARGARLNEVLRLRYIQ